LDKRHGLLLIPEWWELHDHIGYFCWWAPSTFYIMFGSLNKENKK
jgi:hypothetical protein